MRSKSPELMKKIREFVDQYYRENRTAPSTQTVGDAVGVTKMTAYRYLLEMSELGMLEFRGGIKSSPQIAKCRSGYVSVPVVGSIRCGDPEAEEEQVEEYVSLPESIFGKGRFYLVRGGQQPGKGRLLHRPSFRCLQSVFLWQICLEPG